MPVQRIAGKFKTTAQELSQTLINSEKPGHPMSITTLIMKLHLFSEVKIFLRFTYTT